MLLPVESFDNLPLFSKAFYRVSPAVTARSDAEIAAYRKRRAITVEGHDVPRPIAAFDEARLSPRRLPGPVERTTTGAGQQQAQAPPPPRVRRRCFRPT